jgi:predicted phage terminase large subunit-like protein
MPPGTGKSTLAIFYLTWLAGKYPDAPMLTGSHSNSWVRGAYDECLRIMDENGEYLWHDVFPDVQVSSTNAKDCRIDLGKRKRFETLEFTSIGTGNAGLYRAQTLLYCDDLVSGIEVAMSRERLDKLWEIYNTDLRQRKIGARCKELHIATRWSVTDCIGRLEMEYGDSDRARFIVMPAVDENDESKFDYPYDVGFSTKFYHEQREIMDDVNWRALYMNQPIERTGLLYPADELRRYFELPDGEPDAIIAACDPKDKGSDYCCMPIAYQFGPDFYIEAVVCDNSSPSVVEPRLANALVEHRVQLARFESNQAGGRVAEKVQQMVKDQGGRAKLTTKYTTANKETKILVNSPFCLKNFLFKDDSVYKSDRDYKRFMQFVTGYTLGGKNKYDDTVDALAMLAEYIQSFALNKVEIVKRPF